jgi:trk system potassium uptake protein TrkA
MKNFIVIGLGNFGSTVVRELSGLKRKVAAIDIDKAKVQAVREMAHLAIIADASEKEFTESLNVDNYDCAIISTGKDSQAAILITLHLKELGVKKIIVKANSEDHAKVLTKVGADEAIIPEENMAIRIAHSLARSNLVDFLPLSAGHYVAEIAAPEKFIGKTLAELDLSRKFQVQVIASKGTKSGEFEFAPGGGYRIKENDLLVVLGKEEDIEKIRE